MPYTRVGGLTLYFEDHGSGPDTVVIAHGALGNVAFAERFGLSALRLARRGLRVVAYDARGHGRSGYSTADRDYDKQALAGELHGLLDALDLARVSVCGTSMGATSALLLAHAHPERVDRLILRSPAPFDRDMVPVRRALGALAWSYRLLGPAATARLAGLRPGPGGRERLGALLRGQRRASVVPALRGFPAEPLEAEQLSRITAPVLVLTQPSDPLHPLRSGHVLYERLAAASLCVAPSPAFWDAHPDALADLIAAFVASRDDAAREIATGIGATFRRKTRDG